MKDRCNVTGRAVVNPLPWMRRQATQDNTAMAISTS
jgi:hypothetical protein